MKRFHSLRFLLPLCVVVLLAADALAARKLAATGFYRQSRGQVDLPLQFVISAMGNTGMHSIHIGFPNGDPVLSGDVAAVGKSPAAITLPQNLLNASYTALLPLAGLANVQITTMFATIRAPVASGGAMFSSMGGPGSFSFCPGTLPGLPGAACPTTAGSAGTGYMMGGAPNLMAPPQGTGTRNGRIVYIGGSGFGGVSQVFLQGGGLVTTPRAGFNFGSPIFQAGQVPFGGMGGQTQQIGGPAGNNNTNMLGAPLYTQPKTAPTTAGTISGAQAGPFVTTMNALTACPATSLGGAYPNIPLTGSLACVTGAGPLLMGSSPSTINTGFPFSTATLLVQQSTNTGAGGDYFTVSGSDTRTGRGVGNITLVAGGIALRGGAVTVTGGSVDTIRLTLSEKTPSMSAAGFAATALLMVLAAGYAARRRI